MRVVMVAKQKGGVGATTLVRELGVAAAAAGRRVVFVDLDSQGTLRGWWNRRTEGARGDPNPALAAPPPAQMADALERLRAAGAELCVIDTPPSVHAFLGSVMRLADLVLLPTRPTTDDLEALPAILDTSSQVRAVLFGHVHQVFELQRNGAQYLSAPSTFFQFKPNSKYFGRDTRPAGARIVRLNGDRLRSVVMRFGEPLPPI